MIACNQTDPSQPASQPASPATLHASLLLLGGSLPPSPQVHAGGGEAIQAGRHLLGKRAGINPRRAVGCRCAPSLRLRRKTSKLSLSFDVSRSPDRLFFVSGWIEPVLCGVWKGAMPTSSL
jgi:hypothetical protein